MLTTVQSVIPEMLINASSARMDILSLRQMSAQVRCCFRRFTL